MSFVVAILCLGALWARFTLEEYPHSSDSLELTIIQRLQPWQAIAGAVIVIMWAHNVGNSPTILDSLILLLFGWLFVFQYEVFILRPKGLMAGPGVPFIRRVVVDRMRRFIVGFDQRIRSKIFARRKK